MRIYQDVQRRIELEEMICFGKNEVAEGRPRDLTGGLAVIIWHAIFYLIIDLIHMKCQFSLNKTLKSLVLK